MKLWIVSAMALTLSACAAEQTEEAPVDERVLGATENTSSVDPNWTVRSADCAKTTASYQGIAWIDFTLPIPASAPLPTAADCTAWCGGTCKKSSGTLEKYYLQNETTRLFTGGILLCKCH